MRGLIKLITTVMLICSLYTWAVGKIPWPDQHQDAQTISASNDNYPVPELSRQQEKHILYGDQRGGGHLYGQNKNCKSEFPASWSAQKIIQTVKAQAANDNLNWRTGKNGYQTANSTVEGTRIRIVLNEDRTRIITAYPLNGPRNACFNN